MGCCASRKNKKVSPAVGLETVNVQPKSAPPSSASSTHTGTETEQNGPTIDVQAPVRNPSEKYEPKRQYSQEQVKAAQKIGAVARGSVTRTRAREEYHETGRPGAPRGGQEQEVNPNEVGMRYAESHASMPRVSDELRYRIRDTTAKRVLEQLGSLETLNSRVGFGDAGNRVLQKVSAGGMASLGPGVRKQMGMVHFFVGDSLSSQPAFAEGFAVHREDHYLLGKFDCVSVPARADYGKDFSSLPPSPPSEGTTFDECDGSAGFGGWFWIVHAAAPNIGESAHADDFVEYSAEERNNVDVQEDNPDASPSARCCWKDQPPSNRPKRRLDEDLYIEHMAQIWRNVLLAMRRVKCEDAVVFPFGMGAFLRHLGQNDDRYKVASQMRQLRRRVCDAVMGVIAEICVGKDLLCYPRRVHLCLVATGAEAIENHNCFVEAAGAKLKTCPGMANILQLRKNVDSLQLSNELSLEAIKAGGSALSVGLLNGANRKLCGNHWFQNGARFAIDENVHRRSASAARAALLMNFDTEARPRKAGQLQETIRFLGGSVIRVVALEQEDKHSLCTTELPEATRNGVKGTDKLGFADTSGSGKAGQPRRGCFGCCRKSQSSGSTKVQPAKSKDKKTKS